MFQGSVGIFLDRYKGYHLDSDSNPPAVGGLLLIFSRTCKQAIMGRLMK